MIVLKAMAGRNIVAEHDCFEETRKNCRGLENRTRHRCNSRPCRGEMANITSEEARNND